MSKQIPIAADEDAKLRILKIAEDQNVTPYDVVRTFAEEGALNYFRHCNYDPARHDEYEAEIDRQYANGDIDIHERDHLLDELRANKVSA